MWDLLKMVAEAEQGNCPESMFSLAKLLSQGHHTTNIIAALLNDKYGRLVDVSRYRKVADLYDQREQRESREHRERRQERRPERRSERTKTERRQRSDFAAKPEKKHKRKANTSRFKGR